MPWVLFLIDLFNSTLEQYDGEILTELLSLNSLNIRGHPGAKSIIKRTSTQSAFHRLLTLWWQQVQIGRSWIQSFFDLERHQNGQTVSLILIRHSRTQEAEPCFLCNSRKVSACLMLSRVERLICSSTPGERPILCWLQTGTKGILQDSFLKVYLCWAGSDVRQRHHFET